MKKLLYSLASFSSFGLFFPSFLIGSSKIGSDRSRYIPYAPKMQESTGPATPLWEKPEYIPTQAEGSSFQDIQKYYQNWGGNFGSRLRDVGSLGLRELPNQDPPEQIPPRRNSTPNQNPLGQTPSRHHSTPNQNPLGQTPSRHHSTPNQNPPRQLIDQLPNHFSMDDIDGSNNDLLTLLAKINESGKFNGKINLQSVKFKDGKKTLKTISQRIPVILLRVNPNGSFKPFFFIDLSILSPNGNNTCKSGYLSDGNIRNALSNSTLGQGKGWKNTHTLNNWRLLLAQGNALFFVEFNNQFFVLVPKIDVNENITNITSKNWNTSLGKKMLMGAGAVAAAGAAAYGIYYLINSNNPKPGPIPPPEPAVLPPEPVPPPEPAVLPPEPVPPPEPVISETKPPEPVVSETKPPNVHQMTQNAIAAPVQRSVFHDPYNNSEILRAIADEFWKINNLSLWSVPNKAEKVSMAIANYIRSGNIQEFSNWLHSLLTTDTDYKSKEHYMLVMQQDPIMGPLLRSTWFAYETLYNYSLGKTSAADVENKTNAAKGIIQHFFNSPNGALGMNNVMTFLRIASGKAGTTFAQAPYDPTIQKPTNIVGNVTDTQGAHAVACLIGLRSIEALLAHLKGNSNFSRIADGEERIF